MSFVPKYQWLTELSSPICDGCDIVQVDRDFDKKFQVAFTPTEVLNQDFTGGDLLFPIEEIWVGLGSYGSGSGTGLYYGFTIEVDTTLDSHWVFGVVFQYEGTTHAFIFATYDTYITPDILEIEYDYYTVIKSPIGVNTDTLVAYLLGAINLYLNEFGISAVWNGSNSLTVYGFPENSQMGYNGPTGDYANVVTEGIGANTFSFDNFLPLYGTACFTQLSVLNDIPGGATSAPSIFTLPIPIATIGGGDKRLVITTNYTNNFSDPVTIKLIIRDASYIEIYSFPIDAEQGTNTVTWNYTTPVSPSTEYYFQIMISSISGEIYNSFEGFCFNSFLIQSIPRISTISVTGCTTENVGYSEEYNDVYNSLITMDIGSIPNGVMDSGKWSLTITDDEGNVFNSIMYETIDGTNCTTRNLLRLKWWSDCAFSNIDYANLPFVNDVYIKGYSVSQPIDNRERVVNTLSSGEIAMIYNYSLEKTEFNIGLYTSVFFRTLQRAFEHKTITIDGETYKQDSDSVLTKKPEGNKYSAKIDLIESGSEVITSKCC